MQLTAPDSCIVVCDGPIRFHFSVGDDKLLHMRSMHLFLQDKSILKLGLPSKEYLGFKNLKQISDIILRKARKCQSIQYQI